MTLKAPFVYMGGKSQIADMVWEGLGDPKQYIEPFFGSGAVLLARPPSNHGQFYEIICDKDGNIANVWRSIQFAPDEVAKWCDWPINHADLTARRKKLIAEEKALLENLCNDDMYCNPKLAGYWIWAASCWIGGGLMSPIAGNKRPHLTCNQGIQSASPACDRPKGIHSRMPRIASNEGIHSKVPHLTRNQGVSSKEQDIYDWMRALSARLRDVKVVCGDWTRVCGGNWQDNNAPVGLFFDPPYASQYRDKKIYHCEDLEVALKVEEWVLERGRNPNYRICVAGYDDEYGRLIEAGWRVEQWSAQGGYSNLGKKDTPCQANRHRERLLFSPYCLKTGLF